MSSYEVFAFPNQAQPKLMAYFAEGHVCCALFWVPFFKTADASPFAGPNAGQALFAGPKVGETPSLLLLSSLGLHLMPAIRGLLILHFNPIQCPCSFSPLAMQVSWWVCCPLWPGSLALAFSPRLCWGWPLGSWQGCQEEIG